MKFLVKIVAVLILSISTAYAGYYDTYNISSYHYKQFGTSDNANIGLYDSKYKLKGLLIFLSVDAAQLPDSSKDSNGLIRLYYTRSNLHDVIDLLRNESPIRINYWNGPEKYNSHIGTAKKELVGEGE